MLKLKKLQILGFKSFCDRTELKFHGDGVAAIIGPNGCGKSNIADAISWVLGEQSAKTLRGSRMEDVIFAGTRDRKPTEMAEVSLTLIDPEQYRGKHVIVVGGGDSALEAAASIAELGDTTVALSYRGDAFQRAKQRNRQRVDEASAKGQLNVLLNSQVREIRPEEVVMKQADKEIRLRNDAVIVSAGGILPNDFLKSIGIQVETKWGTE